MAALLDIIKKGSTDRSVTLRIIDSTDGTPEVSVTFETTGIALWYRRQGGALVAITEATLAAVDSAHSDGGFIHIADGEYRLDLPDAAFATGANHVDVGGTVTGMVVIGGRVRLVDVDLEDAVRAGLTALPNAAAGGEGGVALVGSTMGKSPATLAAADVSGNLPANIIQVNGTTVAVSSEIDANVTKWLGDAAPALATYAATVAAAVWVIATSTLTGVGTIGKRIVDYLTGDAFTLLGTPAGASVSADIAAVKSETAAIKGKADYLPSAAAGAAGGVLIAGANAATTVNITGNITGNLSGSVGSVTGTVGKSAMTLAAADVTGNLPADLKAITAGVDLSATMKSSVTTAVPTAAQVRSEMDSNSTQLAAIVGDTNEIQGELADGGRLDLLIDGAATGVALTAAVNKIDTIDTVVDAVKVIADKVDTMLEADGPVSRFTANALELSPLGVGAGTYLVEYYLENAAGNPLGGVVVSVYTDSAGTGAPVATGVTGTSGYVTFHLSADTYYFFRQKAGHSFVDPDEVEVPAP